MTKLIPNSLQQRFFALSKKDQLALTLLTAFLSVLLIVYALILPTADYADNAAEQRQQRAELLAWMQANAELAQMLNQQHQRRPDRSAGQSILSLASQTAQAHSISFKRFEPFNENGLRIWLDNIVFNEMLLWLDQLQQNYDVKVHQASIDRGKSSGKVSAKLELITL